MKSGLQACALWFHQHTGRDVAPRCAQHRLALVVEALDHLEACRDVGRVGLWRGASRSILPSSRHEVAVIAVPVIALVVEKIANTLSAVMSAG